MTTTEFGQRAQSNTRLYAQLLGAGYRMDDVKRVRDAYTAATALFAGQLRPDGRPFVCHLVGVAAILAMMDASTDTIVAGLLHSAYTHGDFGSGRGQWTGNAPAWLRETIGPDVERRVAAYARRPFNPATVANWADNFARPDADEREIMLIRLADTLEDALDHGLALSSKRDNANRAIEADALVRLADALGQSRLGAALRDALHEDGADELAALRDEHAGSYVVGPRSWREKLLPRLARVAKRVRFRRG